MEPSDPMRVNRAPVLMLWAAIVAERLGHPPDTALTVGRAVAGSAARVKAPTFWTDRVVIPSWLEMSKNFVLPW